MSTPRQSLSGRLYRALLMVLPFDFRTEFGSEMEDVFREQHSAAERQTGIRALARLWWDTIAGIFHTAPREHLSILVQDTRYALRMIGAHAGFTVAAVLTLALGIGASTAIFSVIYAVLLKPLPYTQGDQLVMLHQRALKSGGREMRFSPLEVADYRSQNSSMREVVEYHSMLFTLFTPAAERVRAGVVSSGFFEMFGVRPTLGRTFVPADDTPGAPAVLVLSYEYWQKHQGGDRNVLGKTFEMNDRVHTVIGVLPPVPQYPNENDVYMPVSACPFRSNPKSIANRNFRLVQMFGRLRPGVTADQCTSDMTVIQARLGQEYPKNYDPALGFIATAAPLREELTHQARPTLLILLAASGLVLLIACANVGNLILSRMRERERELVVRSALGAGKARLLRQLVTESLLLGVLAAGAGALFATKSLTLLTGFAARLTPRSREIHMDPWVLLFALGAAVLTSLVFGSISALSSRGDLASGVKDGSLQASTGRARRRTRAVLVACQVAFSFVLLIGAGLLLRSLTKLQQTDPGFVPQRVLAMNVDFNWSKHQTSQQLRDVSQRMLEKVRSQPGILSAAVSSSFPLQPGRTAPTGPNIRVWIEGRIYSADQATLIDAATTATPDYFKTLGIPVLQGRAFSDGDNDKAPQVVIINQSFARRYWPNEDPIGKRITSDHEHWAKIVGVVGDIKEFGLDRNAGEQVYLPDAQNPSAGSILVRTAEDPMSVSAQVRRAILDVDPQTAIPNVETMEEARSQSLASPRLMTNLLAIFAAMALVIAIAGIASILALTVNERLHEIGIRIAIGAKPADVILSVVRQGMTPVLIGLAAGGVAALMLTGMLRSLLYEVTPTDPLTFLGVAALFAGSALAACYLPARRATRIDPMLALRQE